MSPAPKACQARNAATSSKANQRDAPEQSMQAAMYASPMPAAAYLQGSANVACPSTRLDQRAAAKRPNVHPFSCKLVPSSQRQVQPVGQRICIEDRAASVLVHVGPGQQVPVTTVDMQTCGNSKGRGKQRWERSSAREGCLQRLHLERRLHA
jgi:hypothetical protein